jgi:small subunit ribosomal protein S11
LINRKGNIFPDEDTPTTLFFGIPYNETPIVNIKVSSNNTIMTFSNAKGTVQILRSCGIEGFKNTRKGTNIAAQATAITLGTKIMERGIKSVRVAVGGLGPGRMVRIST